MRRKRAPTRFVTINIGWEISHFSRLPRELMLWLVRDLHSPSSALMLYMTFEHNDSAPCNESPIYYTSADACVDAATHGSFDVLQYMIDARFLL